MRNVAKQAAIVVTLACCGVGAAGAADLYAGAPPPQYYGEQQYDGEQQYLYEQQPLPGYVLPAPGYPYPPPPVYRYGYGPPPVAVIPPPYYRPYRHGYRYGYVTRGGHGTYGGRYGHRGHYR